MNQIESGSLDAGGATREFFPAFLNIRGKPCTVVGGGSVASRKVDSLLRAGALVTVVAPELCDALSALAARGVVNHRGVEFSEGDLDQSELVIAATDDVEANRRVSVAAQARRIPVNVVDTPALSTFVMPAVIDRSPLLIAISSSGASPVLARMIKAKLETLIPAAYGRLAALASTFRKQVQQRLAVPDARRRFWERIFDGAVAELVFSGREGAARDALQKALDAEDGAASPMGEVYLVGGGPGHPELLTLRALRLMQQAEVVLYDHLVAPEIVELARRDAERIYVGKEASRHTLPQGDINALLVKLAKEGKRVLRLKGGDPFIFGRGGEEIETLAAHGIPFQVVPGITAASGVASFAGIPLTHRDHAQACVFVTGHLKDGSMDLDWDLLARPRQTVVVYMGLAGLPVLCRELVAHGLPESTPAAAVENGTLEAQRVVTGTLASLPGEAVGAGLKPPSLVIVGGVVSLRERLNWYQGRTAQRAEAGEAAGSG